MKLQLEALQTARNVELLLIDAGWRQAEDKRTGEPAPFLQGSPALFVINAIHGKTEYAIGGGEGQAHATPMDAANYLLTMVKPAEPEPELVSYNSGKIGEPEPVAIEAAPDPRDAELAALRAELAELKARDASAFSEAPLLPAPDALMSDWGEVRETHDDITGDMLLDAFEHDEAETIAVVQTLTALRLKHLSEQLNVERARLDREHQATGVANPRSASIDRLLGLLTRRGEV
jgi:hypothetical protein